MLPHTENSPPRDGVRPWVPRLARLMDSQFRIPGTSVRFGLDPIVGLIPGIGDTVTLLVGAAMMAEARRLGLGVGVYARIAGNLAWDWLVGLVPGVDLIADTVVKAHTKNARLLESRAPPQPQPPRRGQGSAPGGRADSPSRPSASVGDGRSRGAVG